MKSCLNYDFQYNKSKLSYNGDNNGFRGGKEDLTTFRNEKNGFFSEKSKEFKGIYSGVQPMKKRERSILIPNTPNAK